MSHKFVIGTRVKHTAKFLKSIGLYASNGPTRGTVVAIPEGSPWIHVKWDGDTEPTPICPVHVMASGKPDYTAM